MNSKSSTSKVVLMTEHPSKKVPFKSKEATQAVHRKKTTYLIREWEMEIS